MATRRAVDAVTAVGFGRHGPPTAIHHGSVDGQGARSREVGTVAAINGSRCFIAKSSRSQIGLVVIERSKFRRVAAIGGTRLLTYPVDAGSCACITATAAIVQVGVGVDLATIGRTVIAVGVPRAAANNAAGAT